MKIREEFIKILKECATATSGEYDPARVVGYGITVLGAFVFYGLTIYVTIQHTVFDGANFAIGIGGISASLTASAAGVWIKRTAEKKDPDDRSHDIDSKTTTTFVSSTTEIK